MKDRLPPPLQAVIATIAPAGLLVAFQLAQAALIVWEPDPRTGRIVLSVVLFVLFLVLALAQYRFVRRAATVGMIDTAVSPLAVTIFTLAGALVSVAIEPYLGSEPSVRPSGTNRNPIQFRTLVLLLVIWASALGGMMVRKRLR